MSTDYDQIRRMYAAAVARSDEARRALSHARMELDGAVRAEADARADEARWLAALISAASAPTPTPSASTPKLDRDWSFEVDLSGISLSPSGRRPGSTRVRS